MQFKRLSLLLALCWMAVIFYLSHQPSLPTPQLFIHQDKVVHAVAYGILAALLLMSLPLSAGGYSSRQVITSAVIASLYGISDEFHQGFIAGRNADVLDWVADSGGALVAVLFIAWLSRRRIAATSQAPL